MNMHGVKFKIVKHNDTGFRVEYWQNDTFWTSKEFYTQAAAKRHKKQKAAFYARNPGAYLFHPETKADWVV
tara:strand:- start:164 stop:376 length:213 start_codon:yes stop_codon:yes gene_type:complete